MVLLPVFAAAALGAALAVPLLRLLLRGETWIDRPRSDRHHRRPVSRTGGIAWLAGVGAGLGAAFLVPLPPAFLPGPARLGVLAAAAALAAVLGRADDRGLIPTGPKWIGQSLLLLGAALLWNRLGGRGWVPEGAGWWAALVLALVLQTALEIFDNLDGVLGCAALGGFLGLTAAGPSLSAGPAAAGAGACVGFLLWNRPPARVHLGNLGSHAVSLLLPLLLLAAAGERGSARAWAFWLPLAWPLADLAFVTASRLRRGVAPWTGGKDHTTHRLARRLGSDGAAAACVALVTLLFLWGALRILRSPL